MIDEKLTANAADSQLNNDTFIKAKNRQGSKGSGAKCHAIGIDHGYKNMKTASAIFPVRLGRVDGSPEEIQAEGVVGYKGKFYTIHGNNIRISNLKDKADGDEYYIFTLAALGIEFEKRGIRPGPNKIHVCLGCGLPQQWRSSQCEAFRAMLSREKDICFSYNGKTYNVCLEHVGVYTQGLLALPLISGIPDKKGHVVLVDIGGETMDVITCEDLKIMPDKCYISLEATIWLIDRIKSALTSKAKGSIPEKAIISFICNPPADDSSYGRYEEVMAEVARGYAGSVFEKLNGWNINCDYEQIVFLGGGASVIRNFGSYGNNVHFVEDININAKGYELSETRWIEKNM